MILASTNLHAEFAGQCFGAFGIVDFTVLVQLLSLFEAHIALVACKGKYFRGPLSRYLFMDFHVSLYVFGERERFTTNGAFAFWLGILWML